MYQNIWSPFVIKFVTKKFKKSPNLVTLVGSSNKQLAKQEFIG